MKIISQIVQGNSFLVAPFGDLQYGNDACSVSYAKRYLDMVQEVAQAHEVPYYFIGMGDYMDLMSPSNRENYRAAGLYSSTKRSIQVRTVEPIIQETHDLLHPYMNDRTVAMCQGHHFMTLEGDGMVDKDGQYHFHTDTWLNAQLGGTRESFVYGAAIVKFVFPSGRIYRLHVTHGQGNGSTPVYGLNKLSKQSKSWEGVDAFAMGHTHKVGIATEVSLYEEEGELLGRQKPIITSGAFMRGYLTTEVNYPEAKQLGALALGGTMMLVSDRGEGPHGLLQVPMAVL